MLFSNVGMGGAHNVVLKHGNDVGRMRRRGFSYCSQVWERGVHNEPAPTSAP
jgi:hypothetical protein